jgi:hypothetical protein
MGDQYDISLVHMTPVDAVWDWLKAIFRSRKARQQRTTQPALSVLAPLFYFRAIYPGVCYLSMNFGNIHINNPTFVLNKPPAFRIQ